jgi:hypothetical protein
MVAGNIWIAHSSHAGQQTFQSHPGPLSRVKWDRSLYLYFFNSGPSRTLVRNVVPPKNLSRSPYLMRGEETLSKFASSADTLRGLFAPTFDEFHVRYFT